MSWAKFIASLVLVVSYQFNAFVNTWLIIMAFVLNVMPRDERTLNLVTSNVCMNVDWVFVEQQLYNAVWRSQKCKQTVVGHLFYFAMPEQCCQWSNHKKYYFWENSQQRSDSCLCWMLCSGYLIVVFHLYALRAA